MSRWLAPALLLCGLSLRLGGAELAPVAPGQFAVATTNLEVTPPADAKMFDYLNGKSTAQGTQYLTDILTHPDAVPVIQVGVPSDAKHFGKLAGTHLPLVLLVVYPTTADNPRADYAFPYKETGDAKFVHMQQPGDHPLLADSTAKYPLIVYSGGYNTHGLWHLSHMKALAARGYIVVDMFHADGRNADFATNLALRSLELRATVDFMLRHPDFGPAIDANRIGARGESAGGHTVLAALGGVDPAGLIPEGNDPRIKAAFGLVPFMGGSFGYWPFQIKSWYFGEDHAGLRTVKRPFLAIYGAKDENVPPAGVEDGVRQMTGPVMAVRLEDATHSMVDAAWSDIRTWEALFFDAYLRDNADARRQLELGTNVRGGVNDHKTFQHLNSTEGNKENKSGT